jgi:hypothetical protein
LSIASCLLLVPTQAQYPPNEFCFRSCELALANTVQFNATDPNTGQECTAAACLCVNGISVASLYLCNRRYCSEDETRSSLVVFNESCALANVTAPDFEVVLARYSEDDVQQLQHLSKNDTIVWPGPWPIVNEAVVVNEDLYQVAFDTLVSFVQSWEMDFSANISR